jgi:hypothetical protein
MILIRWIFSWTFPFTLLKPIWLGCAAMAAALLLLGVGIALLVVEQKDPSSPLHPTPKEFRQ